MHAYINMYIIKVLIVVVIIEYSILMSLQILVDCVGLEGFNVSFYFGDNGDCSDEP